MSPQNLQASLGLMGVGQGGGAAALGLQALSGGGGAGGMMEFVIAAIMEGKRKALHSMSEAGAAIKSEKLGDVLGHGGESASTAAGLTSGVFPAMRVVEVAAGFVKGVGQAIEGLRDWTKQLHDSNMKFADFSASMATVQANQEIRDINLSRERGDRRAKSAEKLAQGMSALDRQTAPFEDKFANFKNNLIGGAALTLADILAVVRTIAEKMKLLDKEEPEKGATLPNMMEALGDRLWMGAYGKPPRFPDEE